MAFFWVNVGKTYQEVADGKFLWAPSESVSETGRVKSVAGWKPVREVRRGDVIFCYRNGAIIYVAVAKQAACSAKRPSHRTFGNWDDDGWRIDVKLEVLNPAIDVAEFMSALRVVHNQDCRPALLTKDGRFTQQYMIRLPEGAGVLILGALGGAELGVCEQVASSVGQQLARGGTREAVVQARIGQGQFRSDVLRRWKNTCPVTGLSKPELLTASHVVPWSICEDREKIDPDNGFPFSPAVDRLFDRGYVSFDDKGRLLVNTSLVSSADLRALGIPRGARIPGLNGNQKKYLARHRTLHHFSE